MNLPLRQFSLVLITFYKKFYCQIDIFKTGNNTSVYVHMCAKLHGQMVIFFSSFQCQNSVMIIDYNDNRLN